MSRRIRFALVATCAIWPLVGCAMTPPIQTAGYGAPGNAEPDEIAIGVGHDFWIQGDGDLPVDAGLVGASLSIPVARKDRDRGTTSLRIEIGGAGNIEGWGALWADGWGGIRIGNAPTFENRPGLAWDAEVGGGGGNHWGTGFGGAFAGGGLGYWSRPSVPPFGRVRAQVTEGGATFTTFWWDVRGGVGFAAPRGISAHLLVGGGGWVAVGETEADQWLSLELGVTFRIPTRPTN